MSGKGVYAFRALHQGHNGMRRGEGTGLIMNNALYIFHALHEMPPGGLHTAIARLKAVSTPVDTRDPSLTIRETEVLRWFKEGKTNWEIAQIHRVSQNTIKFHIKNIHRKLNTANKHHAVAIAMERGLIGCLATYPKGYFAPSTRAVRFQS
ncbi:MAG: hypothetical protein A3H99_01425 [Gallionellales bacterium RIFCSPLOWO2_02_FULL_59_110]|nr:MAG: hypothetical protein A3H99_01425 [Gallionellales bacterium RIFCSPLOWO2_02_FULL_59_110]